MNKRKIDILPEYLIAIGLCKYVFITVAMVCFPIAIAKSAIALLQGYLACINLGSVDVEERAQAARRRAD